MNTETILKMENAKRAVRLARASLDPKTAPRFSKEDIETERAKAAQGLTDALDLLQQAQVYLLREAQNA